MIEFRPYSPPERVALFLSSMMYVAAIMLMILLPVFRISFEPSNLHDSTVLGAGNRVYLYLLSVGAGLWVLSGIWRRKHLGGSLRLSESGVVVYADKPRKKGDSEGGEFCPWSEIRATSVLDSNEKARWVTLRVHFKTLERNIVLTGKNSIDIGKAVLSQLPESVVGVSRMSTEYAVVSCLIVSTALLSLVACWILYHVASLIGLLH